MKRKYQSIIAMLTTIFVLTLLGRGLTTAAPLPASGLTNPQATPTVCTAAWSVVPSPGPSTSSNSLSGVAAISSNDVWAVGSYTVNSQTLTLAEHWDGMNWGVIPTPNPTVSYNRLTGVAATSSNDVWAVGYTISNTAYYSLIEHWNGTSWSIVPNSLQYSQLLGVTALSPNDVWAVGAGTPDGGVDNPLIELWNGSTWSVTILTGPGSRYNQLSSVAAISATDVWAVGYAENHGLSGTLQVHWDGTSWNIMSEGNAGTDDSLSSVAAISSNNVWAVGSYYPNPNEVTLVEHWDGSNWSVIPSPPGPGIVSNQLNSISAASANDVWAVGQSESNTQGNPNATLMEHWDGSSWTLVASPSPGSSSQLNGVIAISSSNIWAVGSYSDANGNSYTLVEHYNPSSCNTATVTFTPPPTICANPFVDINDSPFFHAINALYCQGVINGTDETHFSPHANATRAQFAKIVVLALACRPPHQPQARPSAMYPPPILPTPTSRPATLKVSFLGSRPTTARLIMPLTLASYPTSTSRAASLPNLSSMLPTIPCSPPLAVALPSMMCHPSTSSINISKLPMPITPSVVMAMAVSAPKQTLPATRWLRSSITHSRMPCQPPLIRQP